MPAFQQSSTVLMVPWIKKVSYTESLPCANILWIFVFTVTYIFISIHINFENGLIEALTKLYSHLPMSQICRSDYLSFKIIIN